MLARQCNVSKRSDGWLTPENASALGEPQRSSEHSGVERMLTALESVVDVAKLLQYACDELWQAQGAVARQVPAEVSGDVGVSHALGV